MGTQARAGLFFGTLSPITTSCLRTEAVVHGYDWTPSFNATLTPQNILYFPGDGGTVLYTNTPDAQGPTAPTPGRLAFYGNSNYGANPSAYNSRVFIDTPITTDADGDIFFGFIAAAGILWD